MRTLLWRSTAAVLLVCSCAVAAAQDDVEPAAERRDVVPPPAAGSEEALPQHVFRPCLGNGYVPYTYPAIGTCPCAEDCCFPAAPYYACGACGEAYRKRWFKKWLRAHFGHGSMLDGYPCHCIAPTAGRPYVAAQPTAEPHVTPPPPAPNHPE